MAQGGFILKFASKLQIHNIIETSSRHFTFLQIIDITFL
jgi:hypothetical protein